MKYFPKNLQKNKATLSIATHLQIQITHMYGKAFYWLDGAIVLDWDKINGKDKWRNINQVLKNWNYIGIFSALSPQQC